MGLRIELAAVPALPGALAALGAGSRTSATASNQRVAHQVTASARSNAQLDLLYDPQTSGGLLACVATADLPQVQAAGFHLIGSVDAGVQGVLVE